MPYTPTLQQAARVPSPNPSCLREGGRHTLRRAGIAEGFSLVELSIVLVVLGLLVGGILAGQALIRASELRKVSADLQRYETAIHAFRDKYFFYPGDIPNATQFWGLADGTEATSGTGFINCYTPLSAGTATNPNGTCNGNGNGMISNRIPDGESLRAWQHLSMAGMVEGRYNAVYNNTGIAPFGFVGGVNVPSAPVGKGALYAIGATFNGSAPGSIIRTTANGLNAAPTNMLILAKGTASGTSTTVSGIVRGVLAQEEAWNLDTKLDDGIASKGKVVANFVSANGLWWATGDDPGTVSLSPCQTYFDTDDTWKCTLGYIFGPL